MDLGGTIDYNGWTSTLTRQNGGLPSSGYAVDEVRPADVGIVGYLEKRALQDGVNAADVFLAGRDITMIVTTFGSSEGDFWDKAQDLLAAFSPTLAYSADTSLAGFLPLNFQQPTADSATWAAGYIPLRYYVRPVAPPSFTVSRDMDGGVAANGMSKPFTIRLTAKDPRKYVQTTVSVAVTAASQTAVYRGDYPSYPIFTWTMSASGHSAFTLWIGGQATVLNMAAQSTGSFEFDFGKQTFTSNSVSKMSLLTFSAGYPTVESGSIYRIENATGVSAPVMTFREAFA